MIIDEKIQEMRNDIFNYYVEKFTEDIIFFINDINNDLNKYVNVDEKVFQKIIEYINITLQNRDYMLLADILKYELIPILKMEV